MFFHTFLGGICISDESSCTDAQPFFLYTTCRDAGVKAHPRISQAKGRGQVAIPSHSKHTHWHSDAHTYGWFYVSDSIWSTCFISVGLPGVPGGNPQQHEENIKSSRVKPNKTKNKKHSSCEATVLPTEPPYLALNGMYKNMCCRTKISLPLKPPTVLLAGKSKQHITIHGCDIL